MQLHVRAPVRIDIAGAWTDVPIFSDLFGGATLNIAIQHYVTGSAVIGGHAQSPTDTPGGTRGVRIQYQTDIPAGSGLGTSGALNVVWCTLIRGAPPCTLDERLAVAQQAYEVERVLGVVGGKQDQCAAAVGGSNVFFFSEGAISCESVVLTPARQRELEECLTLAYTGTARLSSNLHENVWGRFKRGVPAVSEALIRLKDSVPYARQVLLNGSLLELGALLTEQHELAKILEPSTDNPTVQRVRHLVANTTSGSKCCGAGGGGCLLFASPSSDHAARTKSILQQEGIEVLPLRLEDSGITHLNAS